MNLHEIITTKQDPPLADALVELELANIEEFTAVVDSYPGNPLAGISNAEAFWLYFMIKAIRPTQIIESGTCYGYSMHFIRKAVDWPCRIISFDIDQSRCDKLKDVEYYEHDWMESADLAEGDETLIFFDDHIDQDKRLAEAVARNQQHILFHDNYLSLEHSHKPLRFCDLLDAKFCYIFPGLYGYDVFRDTTKNAQTYRWLTYVQR